MKSDVEENFKCINCGKDVVTSGNIGTKNRNHCPNCLWSKHVDEINTGDRLSKCGGNMHPIGVTFKKEGRDKWGKEKVGELMLMHICEKCGKVNLNRIAADDKPKEIMDLATGKKFSKELGEEVRKQLYGKGVVK
jgi:hypothetical protein